MRGEYDVLIAGTGAAGLYAALQLEPPARVLMLAKREAGLSNSNLAQGGIAAVLDPANDDFQHHFEDTMIAGNQKNTPAAVEVLVKEGPQNVLAAGALGVNFDKKADGALDLTMEGGHSRRRIAHYKDSTGHELVIKLLEQVKKRPNVEIWENALLFDLQRAENGFYAGVLQNGEAVRLAANHVILATGGVGRVYPYTTNSAIATGDGIALAGGQNPPFKLDSIPPHRVCGGSGAGTLFNLRIGAGRGGGAAQLPQGTLYGAVRSPKGARPAGRCFP